MSYINRLIERQIKQILKRGKSVLLLGARQTGKTTLLNRLKADMFISFVRPDERQRYEKRPDLLHGEILAYQKKNSSLKPLVFIDEIQKIPDMFDVLQDLIDRKIANFIITGSSARKLRHSSSMNLLPGRLVSLRLDSLTYEEFSNRSLEDIILYGSLPGIMQVADRDDQEMDLASYTVTYLEEEVRAEAIVRNVGAFARFLEYAATEAGKLINFRKLSQQIGVAHTTIASYYEILEDCLIIDRIEAITHSQTRSRLTRASKYLFFDLGVRRVCAREAPQIHQELAGGLFEQMVGLELLRAIRLRGHKLKLRFWRDPGGPEVDWVIEDQGQYIPIEVKWTEEPSVKDARHLKLFLKEYPQINPSGYVVCRTPRRVKLDEYITAIPWQEIGRIEQLSGELGGHTF